MAHAPPISWQVAAVRLELAPGGVVVQLGPRVPVRVGYRVWRVVDWRRVLEREVLVDVVAERLVQLREEHAAVFAWSERAGRWYRVRRVRVVSPEEMRAKARRHQQLPVEGCNG